MSTQMTDAMKTAKQIQVEMVQWENRNEILKAENERLKKSNESIQAEIDRKTADYNIYISQRDSETKKIRTETLTEKAELEKQQQEFKMLLQSHQNDKVLFSDMQKSIEIERQKLQERMDAVRTFIIAVQRDITVLGL